MQPLVTAARRVERLVDRIGSWASWGLGALAVIIILNVVLRYGFSRDSVVLAELQWHLYGGGFMVALSFALTRNGHVRVDFLHERMPARIQRVLESIVLLGIVVPLFSYIAWEGIGFTAAAWRIGEISASPGGLSARWIIKSCIPLGAALLVLAALARAVRSLFDPEYSVETPQVSD